MRLSVIEFLEALKVQEGLITEFDDSLWETMVDRAIINHEKFRNSIDIVSIDSTDWIIYSNVSQRVTIRMYLLNAS